MNSISGKDYKNLKKEFDQFIKDNNKGFLFYRKAKQYFGTDNGLKSIIEAYNIFPDYFPIKCYYPRIFNHVYSKAKYRQIAIEQYEIFLNDILAYEDKSKNYRLIRYDIFYDDELGDLNQSLLTSEYEKYYISTFLEELANLYLKEYNYYVIPKILNKLIELYDTSIFISLVPEYYRRINKLDDGINFMNEVKKKYNKKNLLNREDINFYFEERIQLLEHWKKLETYKPKQTKKKEISEKIITINGIIDKYKKNSSDIEPLNFYIFNASDFSSLDKKQKDSYFKIKTFIEKNKYIDIQENIGYLFLYIYEITDKLLKNKDIDSLVEKLLIVQNLYNKTKIAEYTTGCIGDLFFLKKDINKALYYYYIELNPKTDRTHSANHLMNIKYFYKIHIQAPELLCINKRITKFGIEHLDKIVEYCNLILDKERENRGEDYLQYIGNKYKKEKKNYGGFGIFGDYENKFSNIETYCFYAIDELYNFASDLSRNAENMLREDLRLPKVGEGWIAETELYYSIKRYIGNKYKVINHHSPEWSGRQHLDICIPDLNLAFEYQGKQHFEPIEYFGDEETFRKQQQRDKRKKLKCEKNKMELHYILDGYEFAEIRKIIDSKIGNFQ